MSSKGNHAATTPTLESDIAAFKYKHPLDSNSMRIVGEIAPGEIVVEGRTVFEIFSFTSPIGDCTFDVRGIKTALATGKLQFQMMEVDLDSGLVEHVRNNHGVEPKRVAELTAADLERPAIAVFWPNGHTTFIDGNHRMVRRWDSGLRTMRYALVVLTKEVLPYICDPGNEERFLERERDPRFTTLAVHKVKV